jgi:hypothetical protein
VRQAQLKDHTSRRSQQPATTVDAPAAPAQLSDASALTQAMMLFLTTALTNSNSANRYLHRSSSSQSTTPSPPQYHAKLPLKRPATGSPVKYPELKMWLSELEADDTRNLYQEQFTKFADLLVDKHKLYTIEDIKSLIAKELAELVEMDFGMASRMIRFAKEDAAGLERPKRHRP